MAESVKKFQRAHFKDPAVWNDRPKITSRANSSIKYSYDHIYPYLCPASKPCNNSAEFDDKQDKLFKVIGEDLNPYM